MICHLGAMFTILYIGQGFPPLPGPNSLQFDDQLNSQYLPVIFV